MGLELATLGALLEEFPEKVELLKNVCAIIGACSEALNYQNHLNQKTDILDKRVEHLSSLEEDVISILRHDECRCGRKQKRGGELVEKCREEEKRCPHREAREEGLISGVDVKLSLEKNIQEAENLLKQGKFLEGLAVKTQPTSERASLTTQLVGDLTERIIEKLCASINNDAVLEIDVHEEEGVGKTAILMHAHIRLLSRGSSFDHVLWVTASDSLSIRTVQKEIGKAIGFDLKDEEEILREEQQNLHVELTRKKDATHSGQLD